MTTDITDVLRTLGWHSDTHPNRISAALAAATASGPLVEDVECWNCMAVAPLPCPICHGSGTVRIRVTRDDPTLAERWRRTAADARRFDPRRDMLLLMADELDAAARIIGGEK